MMLYLDFETRSAVSLPDRGLDVYCRDSSTEILMLGWAIDGGPANLWEPHITSALPAEILECLEDPFVIKCAWNAGFERNVLKHLLGIWVSYEEWLDPSTHSRHLSMPGSLADCGKILGLAADEAKLKTGKDLIKLFCEPASLGGEETLFGISEPAFYDWNSRPKEWSLFCEYCRQDVVAERAILKKMEKFPLPPLEQAGWVLDQRINERGVPVDLSLVRGATIIAETAKKYGKDELKTRTGLDNPNSRDQLLPWLHAHGYPFSSLAKGFVERALQGE